MASLIPDFQEFVAFRGIPKCIGIHKVTLQSSSDTVTVPTIDNASTPTNATAELDDGSNDSGVTVATSDTTTVTITGGSAGGKVTFVTLHPVRNASS